MLQHTQEQIEAIYATMDENEKYGLLIGMFPVRIMADQLTPHESVELMKMAEVELKRSF
jgi:hypothetical protein